MNIFKLYVVTTPDSGNNSPEILLEKYFQWYDHAVWHANKYLEANGQGELTKQELISLTKTKPIKREISGHTNTVLYIEEIFVRVLRDE